jgi:hypothetical protein
MTNTSEQAGRVGSGSGVGVGVHDSDERASRLNEELAVFASGPENDTVGPTESDDDFVFPLWAMGENVGYHQCLTWNLQTFSKYSLHHQRHQHQSCVQGNPDRYQLKVSAEHCNGTLTS